MATLVAWNLATQSALAAGNCLGVSCSHLVEATPASTTQEPTHESTFGVTAVARVLCDPAGPPSKTKTLTVWAVGYDGGHVDPTPPSATATQIYTVVGQIIQSHNGCFSATCTSANSGDALIKVTSSYKWYARVVYTGVSYPNNDAIDVQYNFSLRTVKLNRAAQTEEISAGQAFSVRVKRV